VHHYELGVDEIGASLRYATAQLTGVKRSGAPKSDGEPPQQ